MPTLQYPTNPNTDTAFVVQDDGTKNRALMIAPQDISTLELPNNPNSTKGYITVDGKKQRVILTADITGGGGDKHNLGYYADLTALQTAYPTGQDGDFAILGSTDTIWIWDSGTTAWVDSDQKGQVTSVNNKTGAVTIGAADVLPSQTGNTGKFLTTDGTDASWGDALPLSGGTLSGDLSFATAKVIFNNSVAAYSSFSNLLKFAQKSGDNYYDAIIINVAGAQIYPAATGLGSLGRSNSRFGCTYTNKLNNGSDITVPNVAGEMAVKQVNTTVTLAAASWSSNTQTVNVTGMTATGVVFVSPDPTDQADYTDAGIICSAQAAGTLTFTCDTTPTNDIDVQIVML